MFICHDTVRKNMRKTSFDHSIRYILNCKQIFDFSTTLDEGIKLTPNSLRHQILQCRIGNRLNRVRDFDNAEFYT